MYTKETDRFRGVLRIAAVLFGSSVLVLVSGCSKAIAPSFVATGVREVIEENDRSIIEFSIKAMNPNKEPIPLRQIHYTVELDGVEVFSGVRSPKTTLGTYSSQSFMLPAVLPMDMLSGSGEVNYSLVGTVQYIPPGRLSEVLFDAQLKVPQAVLDLSGTINLGLDTSSAAPSTESTPAERPEPAPNQGPSSE